MRILTVIFLLVLLSGCNKSPDWKIYHKSNHQTIFIDENSIKRKNNYVSFWYVSDLTYYPDLHFLWKVVYDCKNKKTMSLYYDVVESIDVLPKNVPDLIDEDRWSGLSGNGWDSEVFSKFCPSKKTYF